MKKLFSMISLLFGMFFVGHAGLWDWAKGWFYTEDAQVSQPVLSQRPAVPPRKNVSVAPKKQEVSVVKETRVERKPERVAIRATRLSGSEESAYMGQSFSLPFLYLLQLMRRDLLSGALIHQEDVLNRLVTEMAMDEQGAEQVFNAVFNDQHIVSYVRPLVWNIDFKDPIILYNNLEQKFGGHVLAGCGIHNEGSLSEKLLQRGHQRYQVVESYIQQVAHQGADIATNNCGLHALINAQLLYHEADNELFVRNYDQKISEARDKLVEKYRQENRSEAEMEAALVGALDDDDLAFVSQEWFNRNDKRQIVLLDTDKIILMLKGRIADQYPGWHNHLQSALGRFHSARAGKVVFVFNIGSYVIDDALRDRLASLSDSIEDQQEREAIDAQVLQSFQTSAAAHWIAVRFKKISDNDIQVTMADSLGSHTEAGGFLQLWFLDQVNKLS